MTVTVEELREVMSRVAATVTVVTTRNESGPVGLTVSAFTSVSADPAIILVCVGESSWSLQSMLDADGFTVNLMAEGSQDEAMRFATRGADKFSGVEWSGASNDVAGPVLASASAHLECRTIESVKFGDHWVFYGEVLETSIDERVQMPLIWYGRGFVKVSE